MNKTDTYYKIDLYNQIISMFTTKPISQKVLKSYIDGKEDIHLEVADEIGAVLKKEFHWMLNISILDIADLAVKEAVSNGNINVVR